MRREDIATQMLMLILMLACQQSPPQSEPAYRSATATEHVGPWRNRLIDSSSPYLQMHAADPVDWWPWGEAAFAEAARRDVPVFLSIGYFSCHWCHVMHRESFADPSVAAVLNAGFVAVKVDREERPDVDAVYMDALHTMNNRGGWPASLWLTPERVPFYGGTYFPPHSRRGRPGFVDLLEKLQAGWQRDRDQIVAMSARMEAELLRLGRGGEIGDLPGTGESDAVVAAILSSWDPEHKGWGRQTQFPMTPRLQLLSDWIALAPSAADREVAAGVLRSTLDVIESGGMYDHLGGGFHRYTVDRDWRVPHFEKMLYDNAQLLGVYAEAALLLEAPQYRRVVAETVAWMVRDLRSPSGAFFSSLGADSEGEEGAHYVWTPQQIAAAIDPMTAFLAAYPVTDAGNFEGNRTVLARVPEANPVPLAAERAALLAARGERESPERDTKAVVAWNGLAISSLARAGRLLAEPGYIRLAAEAAEAVLASRGAEGELPRILGDETPGVLGDYAFTINGLLDLFEATGEPRWLGDADQLAAVMIHRFSDVEGGGFFESTATDLPVRRKDLTDGSEPAAAGRAGIALLRLWRLGAPSARPAQIEQTLRTASELLQARPTAAPTFAGLADRHARTSREVIIAADDPTDPRRLTMLARYNERPRPDTALALLTPQSAPSLSTFSAVIGKTPGSDGVRAFVCTEGFCAAPTSDPEVFSRLLERR